MRRKSVVVLRHPIENEVLRLSGKAGWKRWKQPFAVSSLNRLSQNETKIKIKFDNKIVNLSQTMRQIR